MRKMYAYMLLAGVVTSIAIAQACQPAAPAPALQTISAVSVDEHTIEEIETDRLVCAVAYSTLGHNIAISCVPNMPGMFEEPGR